MSQPEAGGVLAYCTPCVSAASSPFADMAFGSMCGPTLSRRPRGTEAPRGHPGRRLSSAYLGPAPREANRVAPKSNKAGPQSAFRGLTY